MLNIDNPNFQLISEPQEDTNPGQEIAKSLYERNLHTNPKIVDIFLSKQDKAFLYNAIIDSKGVDELLSYLGNLSQDTTE